MIPVHGALPLRPLVSEAALAAFPVDPRADDDHERGHEELDNKLPAKCNDIYNLNTALAKNIQTSNFYRTLFQFRSFYSVIGEIHKFVDHAQPMNSDRTASAAICLMYKFAQMKITVNQMEKLVEYKGNPFVRAIGFLYLRFLLEPKKLWFWYMPYFNDPEEFRPAIGGRLETIGEYVKQLLEEQQYYDTRLPRLPTAVQRAYKKKMLIDVLRDTNNEHQREKLHVGSLVAAEYADDQQWYKAEILEILGNGCFEVRFIAYDTTQLCTIGQVKLWKHKKRKAPADPDAPPLKKRKKSKKKKRTKKTYEITDELVEEMMTQERRAIYAASSRGQYQTKVMSYKESLSAPVMNDTHSAHTREPQATMYDFKHLDPTRNRRPVQRQRITQDMIDQAASKIAAERRPKKASAEQMRKMLALRKTYGDASMAGKTQE